MEGLILWPAGTSGTHLWTNWPRLFASTCCKTVSVHVLCWNGAAPTWPSVASQAALGANRGIESITSAVAQPQVQSRNSLGTPRLDLGRGVVDVEFRGGQGLLKPTAKLHVSLLGFILARACSPLPIRPDAQRWHAGPAADDLRHESDRDNLLRESEAAAEFDS